MSDDQFVWHSNPLSALTREAVVDAVRHSIAADGEPVANTLDVTLQTMLSLCHFSPTQVWSGSEATIRATDRAVQGFTSRGRAFSLFEEAVRAGEVRPRPDIVQCVVVRHLARQRKRERRLHAAWPQFLGVVRDSTRPFGAHAPVISMKNRMVTQDVHGLQRVSIWERTSRARITFQVVSAQVSKLYANDLHYIHAARDDELVAFGAFVEDSPFPVAWVSYSPIGAQFERAVAARVRSDEHQVIEMARAWNAECAPKNTLSALFAHAHRQLQRLAQVGGLAGLEAKLGGVITAINPNLGFTGMAFRGVDFATVATKPTEHAFLIEDGLPVYTLPHVAARVLGVDANALLHHPAYSESRTPLLHTNLMVVLFDGTGRRRPLGPVLSAS
jgi:hypothetical protein